MSINAKEIEMAHFFAQNTATHPVEQSKVQNCTVEIPTRSLELSKIGENELVLNYRSNHKYKKQYIKKLRKTDLEEQNDAASFLALGQI